MKLPVQPASYDKTLEQQRSGIIERELGTIGANLNQRIGYAGWRDEIGQIVVPVTGAGKPTWSQMGTSPFYGWKFAVNDAVQGIYHIQHDYLPDSDIYLHSHWVTNGTNTAEVKWEFTWTFAKGYNQEAFDIAGGGATVSVAQAGPGVAWQHMIAEIATPISDQFEVDGLLLVTVKRITNGGTDNTDDVYMLMADCHYQTWIFNTPNRNGPDFYR